MEQDNNPRPGDADIKGAPLMSALPGTRLKLKTANRWKDPDPRNDASISGSQGLYRVVCVLQKPAYAELPENQFASADARQGDSYIRVLKKENANQSCGFAVRFSIAVGEDILQCVGSLNTEGCLGKITVHRVIADSFASAERQGRDAVARWLSHVSLSFDIPVEVASVQVTELATGNHQIDFQTPVVEVPAVGILPLSVSEELAFYGSLYREALNCNTPIYQFLCLFKIIEGTQARRIRLDKAVISCGGTPRRLRDRLPADFNSAGTWLHQIFHHKGWDPASVGLIFPREVLGKRMNTVLQTHLRPLRNLVAHAVLDTGEMTLSADISFNRSNVEKWLPLTKCFAKYLLKQEFPEYFDSGVPARASVEIVPSEAAQPLDGIYESPTISNVRLSTCSEFRAAEEIFATAKKDRE